MGLKYGYKWRLLLAVNLIWMCVRTLCAAEPLTFRQLSTTEGLPNNMIYQITQDRTGFIWIASDYGLYRYDGYEFRPFKSDIDNPCLLSSNIITAVAADEEERLWIGTQEGLSRMQLQTGKVRTYSLGRYDSHRISCLLVTRKGTVYAGALRGFAVYDERHDTLRMLKDRINVSFILEDAANDVLIGTVDKGFYRYRPETRQFIHYPTIAGQNTIRSICQAPDGTVYLGSNNGLCKAQFDGQGRLERSEMLFQSEAIYGLKWDNDRRHLLVGLRNGVCIFKEGGERPEYILRTKVRSFYTDSSEMTWIATAGDGLYIENALVNRFTTIHKGRRTNAVLADADTNLWSAFETGLDFNGTENYERKHIFNLKQSKSTGRVYVCVWDDGLYEAVNGRLEKHYTPGNCGFLNQGTVRDVHEDAQGRLWVATYRGLGVRYPDGREYRFANIKGVEPLLRREILDLQEDRDGTLWLLTADKGILHLYGNLDEPEQTKCKIYDAQNGGMPVNSPICAHLGRDGNLWVGTDGAGLCRLDRKGDRFVSEHNRWHLPGDMVMSIEEITRGYLWVGTNSGLAHIATKGKEQGRLRVFTTADGLPDNFFQPRVSCRLGDTLWFGTSKGVVKFCPLEKLRPGKGRRVTITGIKIDGQPASTVDSVLIIPPDSRSFQVKFSSLTYEGQHQDVYAYRLDGYDSGWRHALASSRIASYSNLPPGDYTLQISVTDENGNWSKSERLPVRVLPPFWRTWWAYASYVLLSLLSCRYVAGKIRKRMMTRNRLRFEMDDDGTAQVVVRHGEAEKEGGTAGDKKQLTFELKDLNYTDADEKFLQQSVDVVNRHLSDSDFSIQQMVEELSTSRTTLFKRLKSLTGMSANAFIGDIRLKAACRLMDEHPKSMRVAELAYRVGFNDPRYFSQCFKKKFGLTPKEYQERLQREN